MDAADFIPFAHRLADAARAETLPRWRGDGTVEDKGGQEWDPVTDADREGERAIRALIEAEFPDHGISGEEYGEKPGSSRFSWSLDPVDGTRSFACGLPMWVTLIALLDEGRPVLGIIDVPALDERYVGCGGSALFRRGGSERPLRVSGCTRLAEAALSTTDPYLLDPAGQEAFATLRRECRTSRFGLDGYGYARVAAGSLDLVIESGLKPHDYNALIPLVRAAGGTIGDWSGGDQDLSEGKVIAAASAGLYAAAVERMAGAGP